jgi:hypothetical protein
MKNVPKSVRDYFSRLGRANGSAGGKAAAANMTAEERSARAKKAVAAREEKRKNLEIVVDTQSKTD